jgi:hypothetical protein
MSASFKYVKEFEFPGQAGCSASAGKQIVKGYARGGKVASCGGVTKKATGGKVGDTIRNERKELNRVEAKRNDAGQEIKRVRSEMRYDKNELKEMKSGGTVKTNMLKDNSALGIKGNKNPGETKSHTAPNLPGPKMAMKTGGSVMPKAGYKKIGKVIGEYKKGDLHSGSKSGPKVSNPKQAVAIAMSEARRAIKKK